MPGATRGWRMHPIVERIGLRCVCEAQARQVKRELAAPNAPRGCGPPPPVVLAAVRLDSIARSDPSSRRSPRTASRWPSCRRWEGGRPQPHMPGFWASEVQCVGLRCDAKRRGTDGCSGRSSSGASAVQQMPSRSPASRLQWDSCNGPSELKTGFVRRWAGKR